MTYKDTPLFRSRSKRMSLPKMVSRLVASSSMLLFATVASVEARPAVVVELFTSQGCSSCPPADKLLSELAKRDDVIALTEAVDYWDYLGWKDDNARHEHTLRQQAYAQLRGDRRIYTPQMVLNGRIHVVGSRKGDVDRGLSLMKTAEGRLSVPVDVEIAKDVLTISVSAGESDRHANMDGTLYLMPFKRSVLAKIKRGENRGRSIEYHNVVQDIRPIGMWHGKAMTVELPIHVIKKQGYDGFAILLQADKNGLPGPVYGAAMVDAR